MKINIYQIAKNDKDHFDPIIKDIIKMTSKFAKVEIHNMFNKQISKAQMIDERSAQKSYVDVFEPKLHGGYNIALDVLGKKVDSFQFAKTLQDKQTINFFIGGAYGFPRDFLKKCNTTISLSDLTLAHKIANLMLCEQIFRGLSINNNHPYHK